MSEIKQIRTIEDLNCIKADRLTELGVYKHTIRVCGGTGCISAHSRKTLKIFQDLIAAKGLEKEIRVVEVGCNGLCALGPLVVIKPDDVLYVHVDEAKAAEIVEKHIIGGQVCEEYTFLDQETNTHIPYTKDIPFFNRQVRIVRRNAGRIDHSSVPDYVANDGYFGIAKCLYWMTPQGVIDEMSKSGLRGRGGAGFPTGRKWQAGHDSEGKQKYVVCNADEGDPGAFMDRSIIEGDPHSVIEGLMIAGYAIGANQGYVYVRAEYPIAVERIECAIAEARECGMLGRNILGKGFDFDVEVRIGAGAFVCGEETALMNSVEGHRGEPRQKPPFPFQSGLFGCPTIINNVETLANVPIIIVKGADWYASYGVGKSLGTKVFALAGDFANSGLIEVPMGIKLRDIIYTIGGGMKGGKPFKAVQSGGPSGGCLTKDHLDVSVDYESLAAAGAIMGSGGLIAMNEDTCMVDTARYFMEFIQDESCGHCVPCRIGTRRILDILKEITIGKGKPEDIDELEELSNVIKDSAMCGLGQTAPNPVLSTLRYFIDEYKAHIYNHKCPAHVCKALATYRIDTTKCRGCTMCARHCPADAISGKVKSAHIIDTAKCVKCGTCLRTCKFGAIVMD